MNSKQISVCIDWTLCLITSQKRRVHLWIYVFAKFWVNTRSCITHMWTRLHVVICREPISETALSEKLRIICMFTFARKEIIFYRSLISYRQAPTRKLRFWIKTQSRSSREQSNRRWDLEMCCTRQSRFSS